jgi:hypothetical protein
MKVRVSDPQQQIVYGCRVKSYLDLLATSDNMVHRIILSLFLN